MPGSVRVWYRGFGFVVILTNDMETETADDTIALSERLVPPLDRNQRVFRVALVAALLLHASFFIQIGRSVPRTVGDRSGAPDAIAVDLVTEADLKSRETVALPAAGAPAPPPTPAPQPETQQPEPEAKPEPPQPQPDVAEPAPKAPPPQDKAETKLEQQAALPDFDSVLQDLATTPLPKEEAKQEPKEPQEAKTEPQETAKPVEKKSAPPAKKKQEQARLDPAPKPSDLMNAPPGRSAAASRPPGITRSGENDEFGRAVVRALRQTMPPPRGIFGRVTVRLILTENGDLGQVQVLDPSGTSLDQSVVFATKQTYFPLPPYNATVVDRTFIITYVYR